MSRIGKKPVTIPAGVEVNIDGSNVTVKGPKGTLEHTIAAPITAKIEGTEVLVERPEKPDNERLARSMHGLTRTLVNNMVVGVTAGYEKRLEIVGVGYRAAKSGKTLTLNLGHSHPVTFEDGNGVTFEVPQSDVVIVKGIDKQTVGQVAAQVREKRPPEPYLGKGVKYAGERIRRKAGQAGK